MRIISGKAGGITLSVPKGEVRPTTDRVREAVFSILNPLMDQADVLDLFTGSGAFGLEALSRGAGNPRGEHGGGGARGRPPIPPPATSSVAASALLTRFISLRL